MGKKNIRPPLRGAGDASSVCTVTLRFVVSSPPERVFVHTKVFRVAPWGEVGEGFPFKHIDINHNSKTFATTTSSFVNSSSPYVLTHHTDRHIHTTEPHALNSLSLFSHLHTHTLTHRTDLLVVTDGASSQLAFFPPTASVPPVPASPFLVFFPPLTPYLMTQL